MENITIKMQRDRKFVRHIDLLELLINEPFPMRTTDLAQKLGCSIPTLLKEVEILNEHLIYGFGKIETDKRGNIQFLHHKNVSIDTICSSLHQETLVYKIMDSIIENENLSLQRASIELQCSKSLLMRTINHMNEALKKFNVQIATKNLAFRGREEDIRLALFTFYSTFGNSTILDEQSEDDVTRLLKVFDTTPSSHLHISHFRAAIWGSIIKQRWRYKKYTRPNPQLEFLITDNKNFKRFDYVMRKFYLHFNPVEKIPEHEILWLYFASLHTISYSDYEMYLVEKKEFNYRRKEKEEIVLSLQEILNKLDGQMSLQGLVLKKIEAFLINQRILAKLDDNFCYVSPKLKKHIIQNYPQSYKMWLEFVKEINRLANFSFKNFSDLAVSLTILHSSVAKQEKKEELQIIFAFHGEAGFDNHLIQNSKSVLTNYTNPTYFIEEAVSTEAIKRIGPHLIVANYDMMIDDELDCPIIRIANIPSARDWEKVNREIMSMTV